METHPNPATAMSDGQNSMPMNLMFTLLETLKEIDSVTKKNNLLEDSIND
jgi:2-dehydro-3-deoxyphosphooctonate aldolase (KDO 8-P synthase)